MWTDDILIHHRGRTTRFKNVTVTDVTLERPHPAHISFRLAGYCDEPEYFNPASMDEFLLGPAVAVDGVLGRHCNIYTPGWVRTLADVIYLNTSHLTTEELDRIKAEFKACIDRVNVDRTWRQPIFDAVEAMPVAFGDPP